MPRGGGGVEGRLGLQLEGDADLVPAGVEVLTVDGGGQSQGYA